MACLRDDVSTLLLPPVTRGDSVPRFCTDVSTRVAHHSASLCLAEVDAVEVDDRSWPIGECWAFQQVS
jgi:hypothetical protein